MRDPENEVASSDVLGFCITRKIKPNLKNGSQFSKSETSEFYTLRFQSDKRTSRLLPEVFDRAKTHRN